MAGMAPMAVRRNLVMKRFRSLFIGDNFIFESPNPAVLLVEPESRTIQMLIQRFFKSLQIYRLDSLLCLKIDHQLIPLFDFSRLCVDRVIDSGQKQANDGRNYQLFVPAEVGFQPVWDLGFGGSCPSGFFITWPHGILDP